MLIEIKNWDKYNPKRDQKTYSWLRLSNDIGTDADMFEYSAEEKFVWILILCEASKKNCGALEVKENYLAHISGINLKVVQKAFGKLLKGGLIKELKSNDFDTEVTTAHDRGTTPTLRTDVTNDTNVTDVYIYSDEKLILDFWNQKGIIQHKESDEFLESIKKALKKSKRKPSEVMTAIANYSSVLNSEAHFFTYKWALPVFITRESANQFYGEAYIPSNYLKDKNKKGNSTQNYIDRMMNGFQPGEVVNG